MMLWGSLVSTFCGPPNIHSFSLIRYRKTFVLCLLLFIYFQSNANPRLESGLPSLTLQIFGLNQTAGDQIFAKCSNASLCRFLADLTFLCVRTEHKKDTATLTEIHRDISLLGR